MQQDVLTKFCRLFQGHTGPQHISQHQLKDNFKKILFYYRSAPPQPRFKRHRKYLDSMT
jgi:hypothetical protein